MGRPLDREEIAGIMRQLRQERVDLEAAQKARVVAGPLPACLLALNGMPADERKRIIQASFAKFKAEDAARRAPCPIAPTTELDADGHRLEYIRLEMKNHVPMADVIATDKFREAIAFFVAAARNTVNPMRSYEELCDAVRRGGFRPEQCIPKRLDKAAWNEKTMQRTKNAWRVFLNEVKHWSRVCCKGERCRSASSTKHLLADDLHGYALDHLDPRTKNGGKTILEEFCTWGLRDVNKAIAMLGDSAMTCDGCHDLGHMAGGKDTGKIN